MMRALLTCFLVLSLFTTGSISWAEQKEEEYPPAIEKAPPPPAEASPPRAESPRKKKRKKTSDAFGGDFEPFRFGGDTGIEFFKAWLRQTSDFQSVLFSPWAGIGLRANARLTIMELIFVDYQFLAGVSVSVLSPNFGDDSEVSESKSVYQISPIGGAVGVHVPFIPVDAYVGLGWNWYGILEGTELDLRGSDVRVGARVKFAKKKGDGGAALWVEYRRLFAQTDDSGSLPSNLSYEYQTIALGLGFGF